MTVINSTAGSVPLDSNSTPSVNPSVENADEAMIKLASGVFVDNTSIGKSTTPDKTYSNLVNLSAVLKSGSEESYCLSRVMQRRCKQLNIEKGTCKLIHLMDEIKRQQEEPMLRSAKILARRVFEISVTLLSAVITGLAVPILLVTLTLNPLPLFIGIAVTVGLIFYHAYQAYHTVTPPDLILTQAGLEKAKKQCVEELGEGIKQFKSDVKEEGAVKDLEKLQAFKQQQLSSSNNTQKEKTELQRQLERINFEKMKKQMEEYRTLDNS